MKKIAGIGGAFLFLFLLASCASGPKVSRVNASTQTDLSGYWNDTDVRIVCESLIKDCLNSPKVDQAIKARGGKTPVVLIGSFRNESSEHIDTSIIVSIIETTIFSSGKMTFVDNSSARDERRAELQNQQSYASEATTAKLANELGADFMLFGAVKIIIDKVGNQTIRTYFVTANMTNVETGERIWMGLNNEIKKIIVQPKNKL